MRRKKEIKLGERTAGLGWGGSKNVPKRLSITYGEGAGPITLIELGLPKGKGGSEEADRGQAEIPNSGRRQGSLKGKFRLKS